MSTNPIRLATSALAGRIYAGRPTKDGMGFKEPRYDVTSDALKAVIDKISVGNEVTIHVDGEPAFVISVRAADAAVTPPTNPCTVEMRRGW